MTYINHVSIPENYTLSLTSQVPFNSYPLKHLHPQRGRLRFASIALNLHPPQNLETSHRKIHGHHLTDTVRDYPRALEIREEHEILSW